MSMRENLESYDAISRAPFASLGIKMHDERICELDFLPLDYPQKKPRSRHAQLILDKLQTYLSQPNKKIHWDFNLIKGTPFQQRVWQALTQIKPGQPETYGSLAKQLATSARAVGGACRANPLPIIIPCHRVVAQHGWGGFAGQTSGDRLSIKQWLLRHEGWEWPD